MSEAKIGGNRKRPRNSPSNKRYKVEGRSEINKQKRIAKEKKKMERQQAKRKVREEKKKEILQLVDEVSEEIKTEKKENKGLDKTDHLGPIY